MSSIKKDCEAKIESHLETATSLTGHSGTSKDTVDVPSFIVEADVGDETPYNTGNHLIRVTVTMVSNATDETLATHDGRVENLYDTIKTTPTFETSISAGTGFHCHAVTIYPSIRADHDENNWRDVIEFEIYGCATDIS